LRIGMNLLALSLSNLVHLRCTLFEAWTASRPRDLDCLTKAGIAGGSGTR
jgi:hypothetical protein